MRIEEDEKNKIPFIIVSDVRFDNEHKELHNLPGSHSVSILRDTGSQDKHQSENPDFKTDSVVINNGDFQCLYEQIDQIIQKTK